MIEFQIPQRSQIKLSQKCQSRQPIHPDPTDDHYEETCL
jgi:hypothetical protein